MNAQIKKLTQAFPAFRLRLADNKRWALMAGVGLAVAATAIIVSVLWTGNRGYVSLYGRQENLPVSQIVTVLDGEKLSYRIDPQSGQILVPEDALSKTRMTLAAKGVQAILPSGYELMDKDEVLGSSQFVQNVRYKRSLEGELAQSIMSPAARPRRRHCWTRWRAHGCIWRSTKKARLWSAMSHKTAPR